MASNGKHALVWDKEGERMFETGTDHGVLYVKKDDGTYNTGVVWNGLTAVTSSPSGAESNDQWADNIKYFSLLSAEDYGFTIEAFSSPVEFDQCDGTANLDETGVISVGQQGRKSFGFSWRTLLGNDIQKTEYGYKIHVVYNATAGVSERSYATVNDSPEAITLSWECSTTPINAKGKKPFAHMEIDMTKANAAQKLAITSVLYGYEDSDLTEDDASESDSGVAVGKFRIPANLKSKIVGDPILLLPDEWSELLEANKNVAGTG